VWKKQGAGWVGTVPLKDGRRGNIVLVDSRQNPKGAILVTPNGEETGEVATVPLSSALHGLHPAHVIEALCMQERAFGTSGLTPPVETAET
jgi:hypothetical protein